MSKTNDVNSPCTISNSSVHQILVSFKTNVENNEPITKIFSWLLGPLSILPGFVNGHICKEILGDDRLIFCTQWDNLNHLERFLCSKQFTAVLNALEYASESPEVSINALSDTRGLGYIGKVRKVTGAIPPDQTFMSADAVSVWGIKCFPKDENN